MGRGKSARIRRRTGTFAGVIALGSLLCVPYATNGASHGPFPGFTGAPGEDTCRHCHDTYQLNPVGGEVSIVGFPETYIPGQSYPITVALTSADGLRWGFQATVLTAKRKRAGKLIATDAARTQVVPGYFITNRVYIEQTAFGSYRGIRSGVTWTFNWQAPKKPKGQVTIFVTGNVADNNGKPTGDLIYSAKAVSSPVDANDSDDS